MQHENIYSMMKCGKNQYIHPLPNIKKIEFTLQNPKQQSNETNSNELIKYQLDKITDLKLLKLKQQYREDNQIFAETHAKKGFT